MNFTRRQILRDVYLSLMFTIISKHVLAKERKKTTIKAQDIHNNIGTAMQKAADVAKRAGLSVSEGTTKRATKEGVDAATESLKKNYKVKPK